MESFSKLRYGTPRENRKKQQLVPASISSKFSPHAAFGERITGRHLDSIQLDRY